MITTTADKCHKCFTPYRPQENTIAKIQSCECADPDVPATLKMAKSHDGYEITNLQAFRSRIKTNIAGYLFFFEQFFCTWHNILNHTSPS